MAMTVSVEPVLDEHGLCCVGDDGRGMCNPVTCSCGPDMHKTVPLADPTGPVGEPDDSGVEPDPEIVARIEAAADVVRTMRGLEPGSPVPHVSHWSPAEIAAAVPLMYPEQESQ